MKKLKSCGVLIVRGDPLEDFLLMKHPHRYDLPKGHVDPGESEMECAMRELEEETGIKSQDVEIDPGFQFTTQYDVCSKHSNYEKAEKTLVIFLGRLCTEVEIQLTEHTGFEWISWNPPHRIQAETIDPLLGALANYVSAD